MVNSEEPLNADDSAELIAQAHTGDAVSFCAMAERHEQRLFRQALALCRDPASAEDLVAETMVEAWKSLGRFNDSCRFSTWLYSILVHRFQKLVRRARSRPIPMASLAGTDANRGEQRLVQLVEPRPAPNEVLLRDETSASLLAEIAGLPQKHQAVLLLRFYEDASLSEIASVLGLSIGTVKSRLHHALEKLRQKPSVVNFFQESRES